MFRPFAKAIFDIHMSPSGVQDNSSETSLSGVRDDSSKILGVTAQYFFVYASALTKDCVLIPSDQSHSTPVCLLHLCQEVLNCVARQFRSSAHHLVSATAQ